MAESLAPLLGERDARGEFIFPLPPSARIDTLLLGCTHYPLLRPVIERVAGDGVAVVDSATATAAALVEMLETNGLETADLDPAGRPTEAVHRQLTTGDAAGFHALAERLFGPGFADVETVAIREAVRNTSILETSGAGGAEVEAVVRDGQWVAAQRGGPPSRRSPEGCRRGAHTSSTAPTNDGVLIINVWQDVERLSAFTALPKMQGHKSSATADAQQFPVLPRCTRRRLPD